MKSQETFWPRCRPYFAALLFALPAVACWEGARVFLFPKLQAIWSAAGGVSADAPGVMETVVFLLRFGLPVFLAVFAMLLVIECTARGWARYRRVAAITVAFAFNACVLFGLATMCVASLLAAPALMNGK